VSQKSAKIRVAANVQQKLGGTARSGRLSPVEMQWLRCFVGEIQSEVGGEWHTGMRMHSWGIFRADTDEIQRKAANIRVL
jgi:hypothetical protein